MTIVVDASVAVKWFVREDLHERAVRLLDFVDDLEAPELIVAEVGNIVWKKSVRGQLGQMQARTIVTLMPRCIPVFHPLAMLAEQAVDIAFALNHPVYDCLYVACAKTVKGVLVTADNGLCRSVRDTEFTSLIVHIEDFRPERQ